MRVEDVWDVRAESVLDMTADEADALREEYEERQRTTAAERADRKARDRATWNEAAKIAQRRLAELYADELASDVAWARTVLLAGETFRDGSALYLTLYQAKKASVGRTLSFTESNRLRRVCVAVWAERSAGQTTEAA